ncbi:MAG: hypothetical protein LBI05_08730 [Planctomycetaceae bacterium]|jgi:hypothetical protein|nr:hypothetical protein [Planctomycetaceae bacterium]
MTTFPFHTTVLDNGMLAVPLPEEFRGTPVSVVVEKEPTKSPVQDLLDYCTKSSSLCTDEELDDDRYKYLKEKYR